MKTLVIAPHPDDETLACGGALLRRKSEGAEIAWLIVTGISEARGWSIEQVHKRDEEIQQVTELLGFNVVYNLRLPTTQLDQLPISDLINKISTVFKSFQPNEVFLPSQCDVHTDHRIVYDAAVACTKWFRYPSVKRVLSYQTISETEFGLDTNCIFQPNVFIDIGPFLEDKLEVMKIYQSELGDFPFPRSIEAVRALAIFHGSTSGFKAAEAFQLLRERQ